MWMTTLGMVKEIVRSEEDVTSILLDNDGRECEFYLADTTWLVDGNGYPIVAEALAEKHVVVAHAEAMTFSLSPKSVAAAVMVYETVGPNYAVIEEVTKQQDGSIIVTTNQGDRLVTVAADAQVAPFKTRNIVTLDDLRPGAEVVLYYDILAPSLPARAVTNQVVLLAGVL